HSPVREMHAPVAHDAAYAQIQLQLARQAFDLRCALIQQDAADRAWPDQAARNGVRREIEARVHRAQRARRMLAVDDGGNVSFRRALSDGAYAYTRRAQRVEDFGGDAVRARHAVADHREDAAPGVDFDAVDLS